MSSHPRPPKQIGSALLSALLIMILIAITVTASLNRLSVDIAQTDRFIRSDKLYLATQLIPIWAMNTLQTNDPIPASVPYPEKWKNSYPGIDLSGKIEDLQNRFNINNLIEPKASQVLTSLIQSLQPDMNENLTKMIVSATQDWILPEKGLNQDKWQQYYSAMTPPYQAGHQPMQSPSEFKMIAGVTPMIYDALSPYLTTLPEVTPLNINTATAPLLRAFNPRLTESNLNEFLAFREQSPIVSQVIFNRMIQQFPFTPEGIDFQSRYFLCTATAQQAGHTLIVLTLIKRTLTTNHTWQTQILRESMNVW